MGTKVFCDLCKGFIAEYGKQYETLADEPQLNKPFVISTSYEGKSLFEESIGWSGPRETLTFWACKDCNTKFMASVRRIAKELGLEI